jgi:hypothetical protein
VASDQQPDRCQQAAYRLFIVFIIAAILAGLSLAMTSVWALPYRVGAFITNLVSRNVDVARLFTFTQAQPALAQC